MFTLEEFKTKKEEIAEQQKLLKNSLKDVFNKGIKELFDKYPNHLAKIYWAQYTPYFNDGDPCNFGVGEFYINGQEFYDYEDEEDKAMSILYTQEELDSRENWSPDPMSRYDYKNFYTCLSEDRKKEFKTVEKEVRAFLNLFDSDDYEFMFGDHVKVIVTKNGITLDSYDHD